MIDYIQSFIEFMDCSYIFDNVANLVYSLFQKRSGCNVGDNDVTMIEILHVKHNNEQQDMQVKGVFI